MLNGDALQRLSKEYPVGSKVDIDGFLCAKVVGYHEFGDHILVYNPKLQGHNGCAVAYNDAFMLMSTKYLEDSYDNHLLYCQKSQVKLLKKSAFAILKEEYGYE